MLQKKGLRIEIPSASDTHVTFISGTCEDQRRTSDLQEVHIDAISKVEVVRTTITQ
jgi:hypothetical protein